MLSLVEELLKIERDVVVTITAPLDRRRPNNDSDRIRLRNLVSEACQRVRAHLGEDAATRIVLNLDAAAASVDMSRGAHGLVIVATDQKADAHLRSFPVRASVALGRTPATRLLVQGLRRSPRYRLLVISDRATRLFEGVRDDVREISSHGFPFTADVVPRDLRAIAGRFAQPTGRDDKEQWRRFYRRVDRAVTEASGDEVLPLVLAGVKRSTAMFEDVSRNAHLVIGRIDGAHDMPPRTNSVQLPGRCCGPTSSVGGARPYPNWSTPFIRALPWSASTTSGATRARAAAVCLSSRRTIGLNRCERSTAASFRRTVREMTSWRIPSTNSSNTWFEGAALSSSSHPMISHPSVDSVCCCAERTRPRATQTRLPKSRWFPIERKYITSID